jgi:hypothetical protein
MLWKNTLYLSMALLVIVCNASWSAAFVVFPAAGPKASFGVQSAVYSSESPIDVGSSDGDEDDEVVEPGKMRVSEIKAELDMRRVPYDDCFDKDSLALRLESARSTGKADPSILTDFNKQRLEETFSGEKAEIKDEDIESVVANDGTLPGGLDPESLKELIGNPEVMTLLQNTKMQEAMQIMMTGGQEELEKAMADDPEMLEIIGKLNKVLGNVAQ